MSRTIAFGDIHGHDLTLATLLARIQPTTEDTLVFIGDYIDRGPNSKGVIDRILALKASGINCVCLMGNHESFLLDALGYTRMREDGAIDGGENLLLFPQNGLPQTAASYGWTVIPNAPLVASLSGFKLPNEHRLFMLDLKLSHVIGPMTFVHAHLDRQALLEPTANLAIRSQLERDPHRIMTERDSFFCPKKFPGLLVHGHTPIHTIPIIGTDQTRPKGEISIVQDRLDIDTGISGHHYLTAVQLSSRGEILEVWQEKDVDC